MELCSTYTDHELINLMKAGNEAAFTEIYFRHWEKMTSYAVRLTKSEDEAADIVQEIFVSLWNRATTLEIYGTVISYLIKATRNLSLRYIEKNLHKHNFLEHLTSHYETCGSEIVDRIIVKELQSNVDHAVAKLPAKMQEIYLLSRKEQLSYREISQRLGITEGTVKKQISNALKIISSSLSPGILGAFHLLLKHLLRH